MSLHNPNRHKYRPYLTTEDMIEIIVCLKERPNPRRVALSRYFETFNIKIERGLMAPSVTLEPSMMEKLELIPISSNNLSDEQIYNKWRFSAKDCSPLELERVLTYRYENNLMNEQEELEYERTTGLV